MKQIKLFFRTHYRFYLWLISVMSILSISWLGDLVAGGDMFVWLTDIVYNLSPRLHTYVIGTSGTIMAFLLLTAMSLTFTLLLYKQGQAWFRPITSLKKAGEEPAKALILNVSINKFVASEPSSISEKGIIFQVKGEPETQFCLKQCSLEEDINTIQALGFLWNWGTIIRSIKENLNSELKNIVLVYTVSGEKEDGQKIGAIEHKADIEKWLKGYPELENATLHTWELDKNKADIETIYTQYCDCIESLETEGIDSRDIVVGVTGGTADMSIAASMATLHKKSKFEYINQTDGKLHKYDLVIQRPIQ
ncbi:hypothetical protein OH458_15425 [Vibrio sp. MarTm2]|uniref:hypothetical protein n=1 Tax=Vibrio sp. MarTm2 TaxID=2998831 RepID=UPI0022CD75C6|nr:hypothetical protein [Vibrio sp. MarTm2]MDA0129459.1 hypothetical protein [Vibrio sp. MarTm2]